MSLEALWSISFGSHNGNFGAGVVVIESGRILGGDSQFTYIGNVRADRGAVHAKVKVQKFVEDGVSIFGLDRFELELTGAIDEGEMRLNGYVVGSPDNRIAVHMIRRAELPNP